MLEGAISMTIYLYKKTHNKTGLQYLGKTISSDPHKYKGSGTRWKNHVKHHGYDVTTEILRECQTNEDVKHWGKYYSELWNVVDDPSWANLKPEEGEGGFHNCVMTEEKRRKISISLTGRKLAEEHSQKAMRNLNTSEAKEKRIATQKVMKVGVFNEEQQKLNSEKARSPEAIIKKKQTMKNNAHQRGVKNSQYGTIWITDGLTNQKINKDSPIPDRWRKGRKL
jgi:hypothetical protein